MSEPSSSPPATHRAHTEPLPCQGLFSPHHPTEPPHGLYPIKTYFLPISPQSTLLFNVIYQNREKKTKSVETNFTWLRLVLKKMRFSKIANLVNAPAIHNQDIVARTFQSPPADHRAHTEPLSRQDLFFPQQPTSPSISENKHKP